MKARYILLTFVILAMMCWGCQTAWDNYFEEKEETEGVVYPMNLLEYMETKQEYSDFVDLLHETGVAGELAKDQMLTVWALPNDLMPQEISSYNLSEKRRFIRNHINNVALYKSKLDGTRKIHTLEGKVLVTGKDRSFFYIDNCAVIHMNQICKNGVVHEVKGPLIPRKNIYEYMMECGDEFSIFRDTLNGYNDTIFRPDLSTPLGVNEWGNTIYDSVFVIENPFFSKGDLKDEEADLTLMLPSNKAMKQMLINVTSYFDKVQREFTAKDTSEIMSWLIRSVIHSGRIVNYAGVVNRYSVHNLSWRTDKQLVQEDYTECSNGNVFITTSVTYPKSRYMEQVQIQPNYIFFSSDMNQKAWASWTDGVTSAAPTTLDSHEILYINCKADADAAFTFSSVVKNLYGDIYEVRVMPGFYRLSASFRTAYSGKIALSVITDDGEEKVVEFDSSSEKYKYIPIENTSKKDGNNGLLLDKFEVKAEWGYNPIRFKIANVGKKDRMTPEYFLLTPTNDNY